MITYYCFQFQLNSTASFSDWEWHSLNLNRIDGKLSTVVDGISASFRIAVRYRDQEVTFYFFTVSFFLFDFEKLLTLIYICIFELSHDYDLVFDGGFF